MRLPIPQDWDEQSWRCVVIEWPDSIEYASLFRGLLSFLMRGRVFDERTGSVVDAQQVGRQIWYRNFPLRSCDDATAPANAASTQSTGAGITIIGEDEMGQVVTEVFIDPTTQELVVKYGHCCEDRFALAVLGDGSVGATEGEEITVVVPGEFPPTVGYTRCGKATWLIERIEAIGHACWNNRTTPWDTYNAWRAANPGYSLSQVAAQNVWLAMAGLSVAEGLTDTDIFNAEFLRDWKCYLYENILGDDEDTMQTTEFNLFQYYPLSYAWLSESPDLDVVYDSLVSQFWQHIVIGLGRERCNQIMLESANQAGDCADCGVPPSEEAYTWDYTYDFTLNTAEWTQEDGDGWELGVGHKGTNNWAGTGTFLRILSNAVVGPMAGSIKLVEYTFQHTPGNGVYSDKGLCFRAGGVDGATIITTEEVLSGNETSGFYKWRGTAPYGMVTADNLAMRIRLGEEDNGPTRIVLSKLRIAGTGDPCAPAPGA